MRIHHFVHIPQATVNSTSRHSHQANVVSVHLLAWQGALCAATSPQRESLWLAAVTLVTSRGHHHRVHGPPQRFKPTDLTIMRVQHQLHFENVACDVMCEHICTLPECMNRVRTNLVRVAPSKLIHGEAGLFACEDIEEGTVDASFGAVRPLREGEEGTRTRLGYSFIVKEREAAWYQ